MCGVHSPGVPHGVIVTDMESKCCVKSVYRLWFICESIIRHRVLIWFGFAFVSIALLPYFYFMLYVNTFSLVPH